MVSQYVCELTRDLTSSLLLNVDRVTRSRKTFTVLKACAQIQELAQQARQGNPIFCTTLIDIIAFNIIGKTLYSLLRLLVKKKKSDLLNVTLQSLQAQFQNTRFLIIDKKSMIDLKILSLIDDYLRAIFPDRSDQSFSSLNVLLCDDFFQLLPVGGHPLYTVTPTGLETIKRQCLYRAFDYTLRLTQVMQQ